MSIVTETLHELLCALVNHGVMRNLAHPVFQLALRRQLAEKKQVRDFEVGAVLGQHFNRVSPVAQDPLITVNEGDCAAAGGRVHEGWVIGHEPEIFWARFNLAQIHRPDRSVLDRQGIVLPRSVVSDCYSVLRHSGDSWN